MVVSTPDGESSRARALTGPEKAAALLFVMARPAAIRILRQLEPGELRLVTQAATSLGAVTVSVIENLAEELAVQLAVGPDICGTHEEAHALLSGAFTPDQVAGILSEPIVEAAETLWQIITKRPEPVICEWLMRQHPQAAAFVLGRVSPDLAARLIGTMPVSMRAQALQRMLGCGPVTDEMIDACEPVLREELAGTSQQKPVSERPARIASILNQMDTADGELLLKELAAVRPQDAAAVRTFMFSFDDIARLSKQARSILFDQVPTEKVVLALRGADPTVREAVLTALAARARRIVESELLQDSASAQRDVLKARRTIADLVLSLAERGQVELGEPLADAA